MNVNSKDESSLNTLYDPNSEVFYFLQFKNLYFLILQILKLFLQESKEKQNAIDNNNLDLYNKDKMIFSITKGIFIFKL